ncbi:MAG: hypothetical protein WAT74_07490 [Flavobacteriales bacterium]
MNPSFSITKILCGACLAGFVAFAPHDAAAQMQRQSGVQLAQHHPPFTGACDFKQITATRTADAVLTEWEAPLHQRESVYHFQHSPDGISWVTSHVLAYSAGPEWPETRSSLEMHPLPNSAYIRIKHLVGRETQCITHAVAINDAAPATLANPEPQPEPMLVHARP